VIPVLEILRPIALLADAVSGSAYSRVYGKSRSGPPRRFDWFIAVSTDLVRPEDGATVPRSDLSFLAASRSGQAPASTRSARRPDTPVPACVAGTRDVPSRSCRAVPRRLPEAERLPRDRRCCRRHDRGSHGIRDHHRHASRCATYVLFPGSRRPGTGRLAFRDDHAGAGRQAYPAAGPLRGTSAGPPPPRPAGRHGQAGCSLRRRCGRSSRALVSTEHDGADRGPVRSAPPVK